MPSSNRLRVRTFVGAVGLGAALLVQGCGEEECTAIGCVDGVSLLIVTSDGTLSAGEYAFQVVVDGVTHTCDFRAPDELPASLGSVTEVDCSDDFRLTIAPQVTCREERTEQMASQSCTPIPDHWEFRADLQGTPSRVEVTVVRDGTTLASESREPRYESVSPNGPTCSPTCRQANETVVSFEEEPP